jgi:hypothetical protein
MTTKKQIITMKQKIEMLRPLRKISKQEFEERSGITRFKLSRIDGPKDALTCEEVWRIAECFGAEVLVSVRCDGGELERPLTCRSADVNVSARQLAEIFGGEAEIIFWLPDLNMRV